MSAPDQLVHEFELGHRGTVRARLGEFKGKKFADIRLWVEPREAPGGDLIPTSKGLSVPPEYLAELAEAVAALAAAVRRL